MDGINPGRQCQFDIENSNDLHTQQQQQLSTCCLG